MLHWVRYSMYLLLLIHSTHTHTHMGFQCIHLKSLSYCPISSEPDITLKEEVLSDMVRKKLISDNTKKMCLARKQKAKSESCPLSKEVSFGNGTSKICVSVQEISIIRQYPPDGSALTSVVLYLHSVGGESWDWRVPVSLKFKTNSRYYYQ